MASIVFLGVIFQYQHPKSTTSQSYFKLTGAKNRSCRWKERKFKKKSKIRCRHARSSRKISETPERKDISTCWSMRPICINGASIKEYKVHNKGQCAPLTRTLCQRAHTSKSSRCCRGCGTFPPTPGWETNGTKTATPQSFTGAGKETSSEGSEKANREGPAPSYWVSGAFPAAPSNNKHTRAQAQLKWTLPSLQGFCPQSGRRFEHLLTLLVKEAPCGSCHVHVPHTEEEKPEMVLTTAAESSRSHFSSS